MENYAEVEVSSSALPFAGHAYRGEANPERSIREMVPTAPKILLLKSANGSARFSVDKLANTLLLPLETCTISLSNSASAPFALPLGQAMIVCGATSNFNTAQIVEGSCIAVQMSLKDCNDIQPSRKAGIVWSDTPIITTSQQLSALANLASRYVCNGIATSTSVVSAIATMSFVEVILLLSNQKSIEQLNLTDQHLTDIESFIDDHLEESIGLKQLAQLCKMSVSKFAKAFKAKTGTSPYKFVLSRRLSLACDLLQTTDCSLADIAYEAGFSSQSHMTEFFRRTLSTTPGKYRTMNSFNL